jgi:hypothetical protein
MSVGRRLGMIAGLASLLMLAACAEEPPYFGPIGDGHSTGYSDQQIDQNRYRVTYVGDSQTPRTTVENFLLLRAAQVSLRAGYPGFTFDNRDTKTDTRYFSTFDGWPGWRGYGRYRWGPGFGDDADLIPITRYQAYAEIVLLTDDQARKDPKSLNAQSVIDHLSPLVAPPPAPPH